MFKSQGSRVCLEIVSAANVSSHTYSDCPNMSWTRTATDTLMWMGKFEKPGSLNLYKELLAIMEY